MAHWAHSLVNWVFADRDFIMVLFSRANPRPDDHLYQTQFYSWEGVLLNEAGFMKNMENPIACYQRSRKILWITFNGIGEDEEERVPERSHF